MGWGLSRHHGVTDATQASAHVFPRHVLQILFGEIEGALESRLALCQQVLDLIESTLPPAPRRLHDKAAASATNGVDTSTSAANGTGDAGAAGTEGGAAAAAMDEAADDDEEAEEEENRRREELIHEAPGGRGVEDED